MKKTKSQRAQRAGGAVGPQGLKVSDPSVRLCLRRLGDSCNGISQRLVSFAATTPVESTDASPIEPDSKGTAGINVASDIDMKKECLALAHRLFSASLVLFESVGDISNAAMVRCNLSSLQRSLATWEMDRFSAMSGSGSVGHSTDAEYSGYYERSLKSLKEAQRHCDLAVVSFDGSDVDFGTGKIHIPKGNIRNAVALETAHNCLNIGASSNEESTTDPQTSLHIIT